MYQGPEGTNRAPRQPPLRPPQTPARDPISAQPSTEVLDARGWGCPGGPGCSWLGRWDGPGLPVPARTPWGAPDAPSPQGKAGPWGALMKPIFRGEHLCTSLESSFIFIMPYPTNGTQQHVRRA